MIAHIFIENWYHCAGISGSPVLLSTSVIAETSSVPGAFGAAGGAIYVSHDIITFFTVPSVNIISKFIGNANLRPWLSKKPYSFASFPGIIRSGYTVKVSEVISGIVAVRLNSLTFCAISWYSICLWGRFAGSNSVSNLAIKLVISNCLVGILVHSISSAGLLPGGAGGTVGGPFAASVARIIRLFACSSLNNCFWLRKSVSLVTIFHATFSTFVTKFWSTIKLSGLNEFNKLFLVTLTTFPTVARFAAVEIFATFNGISTCWLNLSVFVFVISYPK